METGHVVPIQINKQRIKLTEPVKTCPPGHRRLGAKLVYHSPVILYCTLSNNRFPGFRGLSHVMRGRDPYTQKGSEIRGNTKN